VPVDRIKDIKIVRTVVGGKTVYEGRRCREALNVPAIGAEGLAIPALNVSM